MRFLHLVLAIHCDPLEYINNTFESVNPNMTHYNVNVTISCDTGYQFPESTNVVKIFNKTINCQETGTWTEIPLACEGDIT